MVRTLRGVLFAGSVMGLLALAGRSEAQDGKCHIAKDSVIAKACEAGGIKEAKKKMKELTKAAKAGGKKYECDDCHKDDTKYDLTDDAKNKFKEMLVAAGVK
jgi:hypothetical protein